jgi:protein arginine N-methyltransferase 1
MATMPPILCLVKRLTDTAEGQMKQIVIKVIRFLLSCYDNFRRWILSNKTISSLLVDMRNVEEFSDLYEHEKMISDTVRVDCYHKAIQRYVGANDVVVDLGTGTGILALLAAKQGARKVYAIDHSSFIEVAERISEANEITNIEFAKVNSREFSLEEKVDCIIHEQIGDYLFNENMIENLLDLRSRILKDKGVILPGKFELFLEPVCLQADHRVDFLWDNITKGIDFRFLKGDRSLDRYMTPDYSRKWLEPSGYDYFLCEQKPLLRFDIMELNSAADIAEVVETSRKVVRPGLMDGFCLFFKVIFDEEIHFDNSPKSTRTHWGNCFFRVARRVYRAGDNINYRLRMGDILKIGTWSVSVWE